MSKIFGVMSRQDRERMVTMGSEECLRIQVNVGSKNNSDEIADIEVSEIRKGAFRVKFNGTVIREMSVEDATKRKV